VPRAYEGMGERKNKKYMEMENVMQNKIRDFKNTFFQKPNSTTSLPVKWEVCRKSTFLSLCLAKATVSV
jgi:hypothetical protein